ncbi:MAG: hypothetical protein OHK93_000085 [Ramalina farinacea]|uniref:Uncharacterized protein n=1 Tax=Ramalina farinacea TaxID=258253 RepID=A0AA43TN28_9LECA|nr:hypothetical protein [Ramalina farinacea]
MVAPSDIASLAHTIILFCITIIASSPRYAEVNAKYMLHRRNDPQTTDPTTGNDTVAWPQPAHDLLPAAGTIPTRFIDARCGVDQKFKIRHAWGEAKLLAEAQTKKVPGYRYDIAHAQWLGRDWNSEAWGRFGKDYRTIISRSMAGSLAHFSDNTPAPDHRYFYCHDYGHHCTEGTQVYSWDSTSGHHTVFCDAFFDSPTLTEQVKIHEDSKLNQKIIENFHHNRATTMFREIWHDKPRRSGTFVYKAQDTWDVARIKGTRWAHRNADSYVLNAVAIYVQQHYKSSMSPVPHRELGKFDARAAAVILPRSDRKIMNKRFQATPPGWAGPVPRSLETYDPSIWELL